MKYKTAGACISHALAAIVIGCINGDAKYAFTFGVGGIIAILTHRFIWEAQ